MTVVCGKFAHHVNRQSAISHIQRAVSPRGILRVVRDHKDGLPFGIQLLKHFHDFVPGMRIESSGRLVGKN